MDIFIKGRNQRLCIYIDGVIYKEDCIGLTNPQCEWKALAVTLRYIYNNLDYRNNTFYILTDFKLLFKQVSGSNRIKSHQLLVIKAEWNLYKNKLFYEGNTNINYKYIKPLDNIAKRCLIDEG